MHPLSWFDNRTLLACQCLLEVIFFCVLFAFHRAYPIIRGTRTLAIAFIVGMPGTLLIAMRGNVPFVLSVVVGNILVYIAILLLYLGLLRFFEDDRFFIFSLSVVGVASALQIYYTVIDNRIVPRIIFISITMCILTWLKSWILFVHADGRTHRILFAICLFLGGFVNLSRGVLTMLHGAPANYMQHNTIQTYNLLGGILWISLQGIFYLSLIYFELTDTIENKAHRDPLTGVLNRRAIEGKLQEELARGSRAGRPVCALLIDIDFFKNINDTLGHAAGDQALKFVAETLSSTLRPFDHLGRFGGDEFLLILPELGLPGALSRAEFLRQALAATSPPTLSIGIAESEPGESAPSLLARADAALYSAKDAGRDCVRLQSASDTHLSDKSTSMGA